MQKCSTSASVGLTSRMRARVVHWWHAYRWWTCLWFKDRCTPSSVPMAVSVCRTCGKRFLSKCSAGSARAILSRHSREAHGSVSLRAAAIAMRRNTNREHMRSVRGRTRTPAALAAQSLRVFALCPFVETVAARLVQSHAIRVSPHGRAAGRNRSLARLRLAPPAFASQVLTHVPTSPRKTRCSEA